jgi:hypothetical protein
VSADKPIDLQKRRSLLTRMAKLERSMTELRREFATPEQLTKLALAEVQSIEKNFGFIAQQFKAAEPWLLEMMVLQAAIQKLAGKECDPAEALTLVTRNIDFFRDSFKNLVTARIAKLEDECIQS